MKLRPMLMQDVDAVMALEIRAYAFPWTRDHVTSSLTTPGYTALCLVNDADQLCGYQISLSGVDELHLLNITVAPEQQGRGLARTLLAELLEQAKQQRAEFIWLEVRPSNTRACALYEHEGFETVGRRRGYYPAPQGQREDALVMRRQVMAHRVTAPRTEAGHALD
ncbi:ribosomal protein S18-alanine N-acetyltransferase [Leptothrix ochracea]|uniref:ribosomal protein S18-alanine N-acetyltransferase n=1 Tax=Leptothrix ochracea TaxID=735331 RepID=UPI0034E20F1F